MQKSIFKSFASMAIFALFSCFALSAFAQSLPAPTNLKISTDENGVNLSWNQVTLESGNTPYYEVAYSPNADIPSEWGYELVRFSGYEFSTLNSTVAGIRTGNQEYYFFVRTVDFSEGYNCSKWVPFGTPKSDGIEWITPEAPTNLKFDPAQKLLTWTPPKKEVDGYSIAYGYTNNYDDTYSGDRTSSTSYPIGSTGGKTRYYWVSSYINPYPHTGSVVFSSEPFGPVQVNIAGLPAPTDLKYDSKTQTLSWKPVPGADGYSIYRSETVAGLNDNGYGDWTSETYYPISTSGRSYFFGVRAKLDTDDLKTSHSMAVYKSRINTQDGDLIKVPTGLDKWDPKDDSYEFATVLKPTSKEQKTEAHSLNEFDYRDYFSIAMKPGNTYEFEVEVTAGAPGLSYSFGVINEMLTHADSKIKFTYSPVEKETRYLRLSKWSDYPNTRPPKMTPVSYTVKYKVTKGTKIEAPTDLKITKEDKKDEDVLFEVTWTPVSGTGVTYGDYIVDDPAKPTGTIWVSKNGYTYVSVYARDAANNYSGYSKPLLLFPAGSTKFKQSENGKITVAVGEYTAIRAADVDSAKMYFTKPPKFHATDGVSKKKIKVTAMTKFDLKNKEKRPEVDCVFEAPKLYDVKAFKKLYKAGTSADSFLINGSQTSPKTLKVFASGEIDGEKVKSAETQTIYTLNAPIYDIDDCAIERTINGMIYPILIAGQSNFFGVQDIGTKIPKAWLEVKKTQGTKTTITKKSLKVAKLPAKANYTKLQITAPKSFGNGFNDGEYILVIESQSGLITFPVWAGAKEPVQSLKPAVPKK